MRVASLQRLTILIDDDHRTRSLDKLQYVVTHTSHETRQCRCVGRSEEFGLPVGGMANVDISLRSLCAVGETYGSIGRSKGHMPLQLSTPQTT